MITDPESWGDFYSKPATDFAIKACASFHRPLVLAVGDAMRDGGLLEIGPGSGAFTVYFAREMQIRVTAIDIDERILEQAEKLAKAHGVGRKVSVKVCDGFDLSSFKANQFDVAFSQGLLEHFSDDEILELVAQQRRIARAVVWSVPLLGFRNPPVLDERRMTPDQWAEILAPLADEELRLRPYWNNWMLVGTIPGLKPWEEEESEIEVPGSEPAEEEEEAAAFEEDEEPSEQA